MARDTVKTLERKLAAVNAKIEAERKKRKKKARGKRGPADQRWRLAPEARRRHLERVNARHAEPGAARGRRARPKAAADPELMEEMMANAKHFWASPAAREAKKAWAAPPSSQVYVGGKLFASARAAARAHGGSAAGLQKSLRLGNATWRGLTISRVGEKALESHRRSVIVRGKVNNLTAGRRGNARVARALGVSEVRCAQCGGEEFLEIDHIKPIAEGGGHGHDNLQALCWECHHRKTLRENAGRSSSAPKPVEIRGETYPSIHAAARSLNVDRKRIRDAISKGTLDAVGAVRSGIPTASNLCRPVYYRGTIYPTRMDCASRLGLRENRLRRDLEYGASAWCLVYYEQSWPWRQLGFDLAAAKAAGRPLPRCSSRGCGGDAARIVHEEPWTDLSADPIIQPTRAVCQKCRDRIAEERRVVIQAAMARWADATLDGPLEAKAALRAVTAALPKTRAVRRRGLTEAEAQLAEIHERIAAAAVQEAVA